jgi:hypothetical protein
MATEYEEAATNEDAAADHDLGTETCQASVATSDE